MYRDQVQTGLALSGEFVDCCFRMCSLSQLGMNLAHNSIPHYGVIHKTKTPFLQAWGICILESQHKLTPKQSALLNLGTTKSPETFETVMLAISSGELQVCYNRVRVIYDPRTKAEETLCLKECKKLSSNRLLGVEIHTLLLSSPGSCSNITEIEEPKNPHYLKSLEASDHKRSHRNLELEKAKQAGDLEIVPNTLENDIDTLEAFLQGQ